MKCLYCGEAAGKDRKGINNFYCSPSHSKKDTDVQFHSSLTHDHNQRALLFAKAKDGDNKAKSILQTVYNLTLWQPGENDDCRVI
jgi:hypothetical protein